MFLEVVLKELLLCVSGVEYTAVLSVQLGARFNFCRISFLALPFIEPSGARHDSRI